MRYVEPSTEILACDGLEACKRIELAARVCYKSEERITETSYVRLLTQLLESEHESVLEHASATVRFVCDRGVSHELVRHRIASFSQESTRYCNYAKDKFNGECSFIAPPGLSDAALMCWYDAMRSAEHSYFDLLGAGVSPQIARGVLPNSLKTEVVVTANMREWRHIFKLRTSPKAHPQMRELMVPLLAKFKALVPIIFDDLEAASDA